MASLWVDSPTEILENVLSRLPVHVLCRFRLVCKRWNHLISQPGFASLCAQLPGQASYVLFTPKELIVDTQSREARKDWEILDMAENRFYTLKDSFITDYLSQSEEFRLGWRKYTLAANGGLIYAMYQNGRVQRHIVCNPVSKDFHRIMEPSPFWSRDVVAMSVDTTTKSYRIATMESFDHYRTTSSRGRVYLYDSMTTTWRILFEFPGVKYRGCSSIFMQGIFYILFSDPASSCLRLHSCDVETGALSSIDVEFPQSGSLKRPLKLVVSLGRLFYVEYRRRPSTILTAWEAVHAAGKEITIDGKTFYVQDSLDKPRNGIQQRIKVRIWMILLAEKKVIKVAKRSMSLKIPRKTIEERPEIVVSDVVAFGCADSVVISSLAHRVRYDLLKNSWHNMPENTWHMHDTHLEDKNRAGICSGLLHLDLREMSH